jgi:adenine-specific DNA-methyltransferase
VATVVSFWWRLTLRLLEVSLLNDSRAQLVESKKRRVNRGGGRQDGQAAAVGFRYCRLGRTLLDEQGNINGDVPFTDLARYVYLLETGMPIPRRPRSDCPLLGVHRGRAIYLLYNGVLGDRRSSGGNVLTNPILAELPVHPDGRGPRVVYGEACRLGPATLAREDVTFKQIPYSLREV